MLFKQFYLGCLAQASYVIGSSGEAVVVDPRRDVDEYVAEAAAQQLVIKYVVETHLHADFVSGHRELAARTGAEIVVGRRAGAEFAHIAAAEGDALRVGDLTLRVLETPGHTPESICILIEENGQPRKVLTGDTLFIGDVGRPDLAGGAGYSSEQMAAMLYDSLHDKLLKLPDDVEVWPAHGAGSLCGRNLSKETSSTIGTQKRTNYALRPMPKDEFIRMMTADMVEAPPYFALDAQINRRGASALRDIAPPRPLSPADAARAIKAGAVVLDVRPADTYAAAHIPRSINIGLGGQYASWAGTLIAADAELLLIADHDEQVDEAAMRLARVGLENARAFVAGGVEAWRAAGLPIASIPQITADELQRMIALDSRLQFADVRRSAEYQSAHAAGAANYPLHELEPLASHLDRARPVAVMCAGGYRSSIGTSILERLGFSEIYNVTGGIAAWQAAGLPTA